MLKRRIVLVAIAAILAGGIGYWYFGTHRTPGGQPPLATLDAGSLESLRAEFNRRAGDTRIILLLSPT